MPNTERISEKNIISFIAHCDEKSCHIHATITPILEDGRLSAKDMFGGGSLVAARDKMREWHDWYAAVNEKWGLETKRRAVKGLTTMIENLARRQEKFNHR